MTTQSVKKLLLKRETIKVLVDPQTAELNGAIWWFHLHLDLPTYYDNTCLSECRRPPMA